MRVVEPIDPTGVSKPTVHARHRVRIPSAWRQPLALVGLILAAMWVVVAVLAPVIAPADPVAQNAMPLQGPSEAHPFGTDELGRDVLSRVVWGARLSIPLALLLVGLAVLVGGTLGAAAGYFGGVVDGIVMRAADLVFAFPAIILAMVVTAVLGPSVRNAVLALVVVSWPAYARVVRGLVMSIGRTEYVTATRLLGASARRALMRDVLPNVAGPVLVLSTLDLGNAVLLLSGLSFLGLGAQPPQPEWGAGVAEGIQYFQFWWIGTFPGLAIFSVVLAFNFLGDSLRDVLDPQSSWRAGGNEA
jgi:ABC-type dipeptide/oligopeptide/nickel transport system permease subunit